MVWRWDQILQTAPCLATGWFKAGGHCQGWNEECGDLREDPGTAL